MKKSYPMDLIQFAWLIEKASYQYVGLDRV